MSAKFWAKTGRGEFNDGSPKYHPVICHLADTAAVAMAIMRSYLSPIAMERLANGLGLSQESTIRFCGFMAGSHDLGKVSPTFQFQVSEVGRILAGDDLYDDWLEIAKSKPRIKPLHGAITAATLPEFLTDWGVGKGLEKPGHARKLARKLGVIVGGHHGFFPNIDDVDKEVAGLEDNGLWRRYSRQTFEQLRDFVGLQPEDTPDYCDNGAAIILAGLTTVSDWLASNADPQSGFEYANDTPFEDYQQGLTAKAQNALEKQGWVRPPNGQPLDFTELFPFIQTPRPLQETAIALSKHLTSPCLVMVEASMGEGKTEAALYLTDYLQHRWGQGGFYLGLPTQATSNAMFERVKNFLQIRYPQRPVNLTLSHSAAALDGKYQNTICRLDQVYDQETGNVFASEWHTARKRTLLSPYGVGTLDQGLMGVVRSRHQFVRLFGLAGRTLILDEIHAYDLYTGTLLEMFLEWAAVLGCPVIALSATLPTETRQKLLNAYVKGMGRSSISLPAASYPRLTVLTTNGATAQTFAASKHVRRQLNLRWLNDTDWLPALQTQLTEGGCVAIICSTVNRAQAVFTRLQGLFAPEELGLFHGRFLFRDRARIEESCVTQFGKSAAQRPHRYVLVATQVIEQSLDLDFDLIISDLAPIDLLLQRSGRLHRHEKKDERRPSAFANPTLWLIAPTLDRQGKADFGDSGFIYDRHILLRTWLTLRQRECVQLPKETDGLIEAVYDLSLTAPGNLETVHAEDWQTSLNIYQTEEAKAKTEIADRVKLPPPNATTELTEFTRLEIPDDESALAMATRLGEPSVTTIFLQRRGQDLVLPGTDTVVDLKQFPDLEQIRELLSYSTRINKHGLVQALLSQRNLKHPTTWTSALLRHCRYLELDEENQTTVEGWHISLDGALGVVIKKS
ncbi:MAG: CRISPR-associated helicase Cas3' [Cyanobacteriota bacterium]|jgi:CRISPR-associated endonuclease/helicase Cas3